MKALFNLLWYVSINSIMLISLYVGLIFNIKGFQHVGMFLAWLCIIQSLFTLHNLFIPIAHEQGTKRSVPAPIDWFIDALVLGILVWFGWWVTSIFYFIHILLMNNMWSELKKYRARLNGNV